MRKMIAIAAVALLGVPAMASAGLVGQCADCHTMHNSEQGQPVTVRGVGGENKDGTAIKHLLRMDCIACHAMNPQGPALQVLPGGSVVPQVYHGGMDLFEDTLAAGNFHFAADGAWRKGHNVIDLFPGGDTTEGFTKPPGFQHDGDRLPLDKFTCAGVNGCHGTRNQLLAEEIKDPATGEITTGRVERVGMAAIGGAHHLNYHGEKVPSQPNGIGAGILSDSGWVHDGASLADSYRFIRGLRGTGGKKAGGEVGIQSETGNPWDAAVIVYYGNHRSPVTVMFDGSPEPGSCQECHIGGGAPTRESSILVPDQSMSGFCSTCHGEFHSLGTENGTSGAFLRHPSDYILPSRGEYAGYEYNITAPVAYTDSGEQAVMCLSCHAAHATPYDGMLRFDYTTMVAGDNPDAVGCLACHTTKGIRKGQ